MFLGSWSSVDIIKSVVFMFIFSSAIFRCAFLKQQLKSGFSVFSDFGQAEIDAANLPIGPIFITQPVSTIYDIRSTIKVASFKCEADARPLASYVWYLTHDQRRFPVDLTDQSKTLTNGRLTIDEPSETEDNGDYQCVAKNSFGAILSDIATLSFGCKIFFAWCFCFSASTLTHSFWAFCRSWLLNASWLMHN